jgi:hypothetical protein
LAQREEEKKGKRDEERGERKRGYVMRGREVGSHDQSTIGQVVSPDIVWP